MKKVIFIGSIILCLLLTACGKESSASSGLLDEPTSSISEPTTVTEQEMTLTLDFWDDTKTGVLTAQQRTGIYSGQVVNGIPEGMGTFKSKNPEGNEWYYEGEFKNGTFNGKGKSVWPQNDTREKEYTEIGTYENGLFVPNKGELIAYLGGVGLYGDYAVSDASISFIDAHENFFPTQTEADLQALEPFIDRSVEYKHLTKSITPYLSNIISIPNVSVSQIFETPLAGHTITSMLALNQDGNCFVIHFDRALDIYEGDTISLYGLPIATSSFDNVSGGTTNNIVIYGCCLS